MQTAETTRPEFNPDGMPAAVQALAIRAARRQWCLETADGRSFFVDEARGRRMLARNPGATLWPPVGA